MKRSTLAAIILAACAYGPLAYSYTYVTAGAGFVDPRENPHTALNSNFVFYSPTLADAGIFRATNVNWNNNFNHGYEFFMALGAGLTAQSRLEGEFLYMNMRRNIAGSYDWQQIRTIGGNVFAPQTNNPIGRTDSNFYSYSLLGNLYYDFHNKTRFTPYVGIGAGIGRLHAPGTNVANTLLINNLSTATATVVPTIEHTPALNGIVFVWQLKAGLSYALTPKIALAGQYRLFRTSNYNINSGSIVTNPYTGGATTYTTPSSTVSGLLNNSFDLTLTYNFV